MSSSTVQAVYVDHNYYVKPVENVYGDTVYALSEGGSSGPFNNQMDLSFNAGKNIRFNTSDLSMNGYNLVVGPTLDVSSTALSSDVAGVISYIGTAGVTGSYILLTLSGGYLGDTLYYFDRDISGMGYMGYNSVIANFPTISNTVSITTPYTYINPPNTQRSSSAHYPPLNNSVLQDIAKTSDCWAAPDTDYKPYEWVKINLLSDVPIVGVILQPRRVHNQYVVKFKVEYSSDDITYHKVDNDKNFDAIYSTLASEYYRAYTYFSTPVIAQYIKIIPTAHLIWISLLAGLIQGSAYIIKNIVTVTVSGSPSVFYLDGEEAPEITFTSEVYIFDQSDPSNDGEQLVFGYSAEDRTNILTSVAGSQNIIVMGTPGQPGAYTLITFDVAPTSTVYYYSMSGELMGWNS